MLKNKMINSISNRYVLTLVVALFWFPIIVFGVLNLQVVDGMIADESRAALSRAAVRQGEAVDKFIRNNLAQVTALAQNPILTSQGQAAEKTVMDLNSFNLLNPLFLVEIFVLDTKGVTTRSSLTARIDQSRANEDYFQRTLTSKRRSMSLDSQDKISPTLTFAAPLFSKEHEILGVLGIRYSLAILGEVVAPHSRMAGEVSYGLILNERNDVIASTSDFDLNFASFIDYRPKVNAIYQSLLSRNKKTYFDPEKNIGVSYAPVAHRNLTSVYIRPSGNLLGRFQQTMDYVMAILTLVLILALITNYFIYSLIQKIRKRERQLERVNAEIINDLDLGAKVQKALQYVPRLPANLDFTAFQKAAKFVSGDFCFTYYNSALKVFTFMIVDVNGKGIQAALKAAAFSSIAKSVWTSRESYLDGRDRFNIFKRTAEKFIKTTSFADDFLAVVGCEYYIEENRARLYRLNYTAPLKLSPTLADDKTSSIERIAVPNGQQVDVSLERGEVLMLLGDAFLESSRAEKRIIKKTVEKLSNRESSLRSEQIANIIRDVDLATIKEDDQTILVLHMAS